MTLRYFAIEAESSRSAYTKDGPFHRKWARISPDGLVTSTTWKPGGKIRHTLCFE